METKSAFDEWFYELEAFSLRSERFFSDVEHYTKCVDEIEQKEAESLFLTWLKVAFEMGKESAKKEEKS